MNHGPNVVAATVLQVQRVVATNFHPNIGVATVTMFEQNISKHISSGSNSCTYAWQLYKSCLPRVSWCNGYKTSCWGWTSCLFFEPDAGLRFNFCHCWKDQATSTTSSTVMNGKFNDINWRKSVSKKNINQLLWFMITHWHLKQVAKLIHLLSSTSTGSLAWSQGLNRHLLAGWWRFEMLLRCIPQV